MKKIILCVITIIGAVMCMSPLLTVYADPMDPMEKIRGEATTQASTIEGGEGMLPNTPESDAANPNESSNSEASTEESTEEAKSEEDWAEEEKKRSLVQFMDSVMLIAGILGVLIPTIYMGIYLGARIYPSMFCPIFGFLTKHQTNPEDIPWYMMFLRTLPVAILGMMLATGFIRDIFARIWSFVLTHFLK